MKLTQDYFEARKEAMKWLNSQPETRNYAKGLQILQKSGFKPSVAALLARNGEKEWTREKLKYSLRQMLQVYYNPDDPRFDDEDVDALNDEHKELVDLPNPEEDTQSKTPKPTEVEKLMEHYADYHKQRDIANRERAELPETNDDEVTAKRKELSEKMEGLTAKMEALWALRKRYDEDGTIPTFDEIEKACAETVTVKKEEEKPEDLTALDDATLKRQRSSTKTMLTKKQNMLLYQTQSKQEKPNPMPDCPKRVVLEKEVEHLQARLTRLEYEIARRK